MSEQEGMAVELYNGGQATLTKQEDMTVELYDGAGRATLVETWGDDRRVVASARMSTDGAFRGWGTVERPGDEKLLEYLWLHHHHTPFEMCGVTVEYEVPIFVEHESAELYFLIPHRDVRIPLGSSLSPDWPYIPASKFMADPEGLLTYLSSWAELYEAFAVPKTERTGRIETVAYLTNGWGDEIDSNKTKPGLGRTDDLKKGTYQLLKYGVYYKDRCKRQALYSALLANLDPVNLWAAYLEKLIDVRWTKEEYVQKQADYFKVAVDRLYYLYEAVVALNRPVINEPTLKGVFDFERGHQAVVSGALNSQILDPWIS